MRSGGEGSRVKPAAGRVIALAGVAIALCGCGGTTGGRDALHRTVAAVAKTRALPWVRCTLALEEPDLFGPSITVLGARTAFNLRAGVGYAALALRKRGGASQILYVDLTPAGFLLLPSPPPSGLLPAGKAWISVGLPGSAANGPLAAQVEGLGPELPLDEIAWGARSATRVGTRVVGHVPMDEYRVSVDLRRALSAARKARRVGIAAAIRDEIRATPSARVPVTIWVDGPGYVGKVAEAVPGSGLGTASCAFTNLGRTYTGTRPPSSETVPLASVAPEGHSVWAIATGS